MTKIKIKLKGGPTSGHHGHAGRPGKVGGSMPKDGKRVVSGPSQELSTKIQQGNRVSARALRKEVEANFPEGDRLGYALGAIGDAYVPGVGIATTRDKSGKLVGIATYLKGDVPEGQDMPAGKYFSISYMATVRGGIGRSMMNSLKAHARKKGAKLNAEADSEGAGEFLKKMGFNVTDIYGSGGAFYYWEP